MIREMMVYRTVDGQSFETEKQAKEHAENVLDERVGALIDYALKLVTYSPCDKLKMLQALTVDKEATLKLLYSIIYAVEFE